MQTNPREARSLHVPWSIVATMKHDVSLLQLCSTVCFKFETYGRAAEGIVVSHVMGKETIMRAIEQAVWANRRLLSAKASLKGSGRFAQRGGCVFFVFAWQLFRA
jgi:hypothetical protein